MIVGGSLTGGELASFAMYTMSVSSGVGGTVRVYGRIMEVFLWASLDLGSGCKSTCLSTEFSSIQTPCEQWSGSLL